MDKNKSFKDRIADYRLEKRVITQEELKNISKNFNKKNGVYFNSLDKKIDLEEILSRCRETIQEGEKLILTPQNEVDSNLLEIKPLEEFALLELFKSENSYNNKVLVLLDGVRATLEWNNYDNKKRTETIEISFEKVQNKNDIKSKFEIDF